MKAAKVLQWMSIIFLAGSMGLMCSIQLPEDTPFVTSILIYAFLLGIMALSAVTYNRTEEYIKSEEAYRRYLRYRNAVDK